MNIEHNSHNLFYRKPFGAVKCAETVQMRLAASGMGIPAAVNFVYTEDGTDKETKIKMSYISSVAEYSVYEASLTVPEKECLIWYYFEIITDEKTVYYGNNKENLGGMGRICDSKPENSYQITVYRKDYKTPEWFKKSIAYQIFPDRFFNGNDDGSFLGDRTDIIKRSWGETPYYKAEQFGGEYLSNDFFGGNLRGIIKKLPYLAELGITSIYLNPIFKAYSNHKYDTGSYEETDPMFGDEETFRQLCEKAAELGIRIILDGVFNHTGSNSMYFNKNGEYASVGAYQSENSPYFDWFRFYEFPDKYESWWGMDTLPQVEENSESYRKYILSGKNAIIKKWLRLGGSGWRLDVVDELPDSFVKELRKNAKAVKSDAVIIGEVWEDASNKISYGKRREYFLGSELDSVMNYPLKNMLADACLGKIDSAELNRRFMSLKENYPKPAFYSLLNMLSSHDTERILTRLGGAPSRNDVSKDFQAGFKLEGEQLSTALKRLKLITAMQMTLPGVPCIFYGDEIGTQGYGDPFCRSCFDWSRTDNSEILNTFKQLISLRKSSDAFSVGEFEPVYCIGSVYGYLRYTDEDKYMIVSNMGAFGENIRIDAARFGIHEISDIYGDEKVSSDSGIFLINVHEYGFKIYKCEV